MRQTKSLQTLVKAKRANLKALTTRMAAVVTAAVVELNPGKSMIRRIDDMLHSPPAPAGESHPAFLCRNQRIHAPASFLVF